MGSADRPSKLLDDRIEFKLYAAEYHLNQLKKIDNEGGGIAREENRMLAEIELDGYFAEIIGAKDALLITIDNKMELGIGKQGLVTDDTIKKALSDRDQIDLISEYLDASKEGNWFWQLKTLRNDAMHTRYPMRVTKITENFSHYPSIAEVSFGKSHNVCAYCQKPLSDRRTRSSEAILCPHCQKWNTPFDHIMEEQVMPYLEKNLNQVKELIGTIRRKDSRLH